MLSVATKLLLADSLELSNSAPSAIESETNILFSKETDAWSCLWQWSKFLFMENVSEEKHERTIISLFPI